MTNPSKKYSTSESFRQALETRIRQTWKQKGGDYQDHTRTVAFECFLAHLDPEKTTLKGGYALELRLSESRLTRDVDITIKEKSLLIVDKKSRPEAIRHYIQEQLNKDMSDYFTWEVQLGGKELPNAEAGGMRLTIISKIDNRNFREFHVDVELKEREILPPEKQKGRDLLGFAGVPNPIYSVTPNEAIWSEKLAAYTHPWNDRDNTRVKDIVDMNLLIDQGLDKEKIVEAMEKVFELKKLPETLKPPPESWKKTYPALAQQAGLELTLDQAYDRLNIFYQQIYALIAKDN
jgi:hypothetical protein